MTTHISVQMHGHMIPVQLCTHDSTSVLIASMSGVDVNPGLNLACEQFAEVAQRPSSQGLDYLPLCTNVHTCMNGVAGPIKSKAGFTI